jgi:hypothetical protein
MERKAEGIKPILYDVRENHAAAQQICAMALQAGY